MHPLPRWVGWWVCGLTCEFDSAFDEESHSGRISAVEHCTFREDVGEMPDKLNVCVSRVLPRWYDFKKLRPLKPGASLPAVMKNMPHARTRSSVWQAMQRERERGPTAMK